MWQDSTFDLLLKTEQLLYFRLTFAMVSLGLALAMGYFAHGEFDVVGIGVAITGVLIYVVVGLLLIKAEMLKNDQQINRANAVFIALDVIVLTAIVHITHGVDSDLYFLYLLPPLLASHVFGRKGIFISAAAVSVMYCGLMLVENVSYMPYLLDSRAQQGLVGEYVKSLWVRIFSKSAMLMSISLVWAAFCEHMSAVAQQSSNRLREQNLELRTMQSQLIHQEKMASLGRLVAGIAHELNNPINFVHGNLPYLREYFDNLKKIIETTNSIPSTHRNDLDELKQKLKYDFIATDLDHIIADLTEGAERIRTIIKNLRSFSRLDEAELKEASIQEGLESSLKILNQYYGRDKIPVELNFETLPMVLCYPGQLNQVWMNLLANAAEALSTVAEPLVKINGEINGDWITISVSDNGSGIKLADHSKIFEPFFTTKPIGQGTGLGLSICHSIIGRHGGKIWFESIPGQGTTFRVKIPLHAELNEVDRNQ